MTIGENIKKARGKIKQAELAEMLDVDVSTISRWENNKNTPNGKILQKIARALDTTVAYLSGDIVKQIDTEKNKILKAKKIVEKTNNKNLRDTVVGGADNLITIKQGDTEVQLPINEQTLPYFQSIIGKMLDGIGNAQIRQNIGGGIGNQNNTGVLKETKGA